MLVFRYVFIKFEFSKVLKKRCGTCRVWGHLETSLKLPSVHY